MDKLKQIEVLAHAEELSDDQKIADIIRVINLPEPPSSRDTIFAKVEVGQSREIQYHLLEYHPNTQKYYWNTYGDATGPIDNDMVVVGWEFADAIIR
jgi:broad specificity polyphosphatase/5'/3'-nucleotidase SurE